MIKEQILEYLDQIITLKSIDQTFIRQFSSFFTNIQWKLIVKCQDLSLDFIRQFRDKFIELYNCQDFRALKKKIDSMRQIGRLESCTND